MKAFLILIIFTIYSTLVLAREAGDGRVCDNINHPASQKEYRACLRLNIKIAASEGGVDCENCFVDQNEKSSGNLIAAISALTKPAAQLFATYTLSKTQHEIQDKWAKTYANGFQECTNQFNSLLNYNTTVGANPIGAVDAQKMMACNGNGYGSYAGYGGLMGSNYGTFGNPFLQNGYTSGYLSGFGGPYANGNYGTGMISGSIGVGTAGGSLSASQSGITPAFGF